MQLSKEILPDGADAGDAAFPSPYSIMVNEKSCKSAAKSAATTEFLLLPARATLDFASTPHYNEMKRMRKNKIQYYCRESDHETKMISYHCQGEDRVTSSKALSRVSTNS